MLTKENVKQLVRGFLHESCGYLGIDDSQIGICYVPMPVSMMMVMLPLIPQNHYKLYFLSTWATKSCSGFCHVRNFTYLSVANQKQAKLWYDMAKVALKSEKLTPFGGIFSIMEQFDSRLSSVIDSTLGLRCKQYDYQYSEIIRWILSDRFSPWQCPSKLIIAHLA